MDNPPTKKQHWLDGEPGLAILVSAAVGVAIATVCIVVGQVVCGNFPLELCVTAAQNPPWFLLSGVAQVSPIMTGALFESLLSVRLSPPPASLGIEALSATPKLASGGAESVISVSLQRVPVQLLQQLQEVP